MVCMGTQFSSFSSVVPLFEGSDLGCQLMVYLYGLGFCLVTSALCTKMFSMERVLEGSIKMKSSAYDYQTAAKMMAAFAFGELVILVSWSASSSPLHFARKCIDSVENPLNVDDCLASVGKCRSDNATEFVGILTAYHIVCLVVGMGMCYHVRNLPSILSEGKWVFTAFYSQLQAVVIAVPVLITIKDDYEIFTLLKSIVICASDLTTLIMLFAPKMSMVNKYYDFDKNKVSEYIRVSTCGARDAPSRHVARGSHTHVHHLYRVAVLTIAAHDEFEHARRRLRQVEERPAR